MANADGVPFIHQSKGAAVYLELRQRILGAVLAPGTAINQEQLAAELGVSTTPLREALRRLESDGLVLLLAHREAIVAPLDPLELAAVYEVRENIDPLAAALAAERHTEAEATAIRRAFARAGKPGRADRMSVNRRYHAVDLQRVPQPHPASRRSTRCGTGPTAIAVRSGSWQPSRRSRTNTWRSPKRCSRAARTRART